MSHVTPRTLTADSRHLRRLMSMLMSFRVMICYVRAVRSGRARGAPTSTHCLDWHRVRVALMVQQSRGWAWRGSASGRPRVSTVMSHERCKHNHACKDSKPAKRQIFRCLAVGESPSASKNHEALYADDAIRRRCLPVQRSSFDQLHYHKRRGPMFRAPAWTIHEPVWMVQSKCHCQLPDSSCNRRCLPPNVCDTGLLPDDS